jgi:hypothetical protein
MQEDQIVEWGHRVCRDFAVITKFERREPRVSTERDPRRIDSVLAKCVSYPLRDHDRDHDRQHM